MVDSDATKLKSKKVKLGTTVLDTTLLAIKDAQIGHGDAKTPGDVIDLLAELLLDVEPSVARELMNFCSEKALAISKELGAFGANSFEGFALAEMSSEHRRYSMLAVFFRNYCDVRVPDSSDLIKLNLKAGDCVIVPTSWPILNKEAANSCEYAYAIEIKGGSRFNAPHFLYLSNHDGGIGQAEREDALSRIEAVWPDISKVLAEEVVIKRGENGAVLNGEEHLSGPIVCFYLLPEASRCRRPEDAPYGAMVVRHVD